jgi:predicted amidohydrolase
MRDFTLAVGQWPVVDERDACLERAEAFLRAAARDGAELCLLPEMFQTPYELDRMRERAEALDGPSLEHVRALARELSIHVVAGSFCERRGNACFNTAAVVGPDGRILGVHRKIHLFDVSLDDVNVRESAVLAAGDEPLVVDTPFSRLGVAVCYDTRFPAIFRHFEACGVEVVAIPAAFSRTTGSAHWHLLLRSRAVDYQVFVAAACPAPNPSSSYVTYGHSLIVDPWGKVLAEAGEEEDRITARIEAGTLERVRRALPLLRHRRADLYRRWEAE